MEEFKNLKEIIELSKEEINNNDENVSAVLDLVDLQELKNLIARYKELEQENKILKNKQTKIIADSFHEKMAKKFDEDFIPKSKVQEKIEELSKLEKGFHFTGLITECETKIEVLQELLEES